MEGFSTLMAAADASSPSWAETLFHHRKDAVKLGMWATVIALGIAIHGFVQHGLHSYLARASLNRRQDYLARAMLPLGLFLAVWLLKAVTQQYRGGVA